MDELDRKIINELQGGFPLVNRPFLEISEQFGVPEDELIEHVGQLLDNGTLSRFGPMYHAEKLGGALTLCALSAPADHFDEITEQVNQHPEVAHNYARDHQLNMWFVIAADHPDRVGQVIAAIEAETGCKVLNMPKLKEYFVGLRFEV
ncbi:MAG TPA: Lrp/AsnC family transcriptional regulator [Gammaproteobacteria bacterium]|nr:Lrp/AsnC family transcriptional regulator [Gammaproteobacteria bacterium]